MKTMANAEKTVKKYEKKKAELEASRKIGKELRTKIAHYALNMDPADYRKAIDQGSEEGSELGEDAVVMDDPGLADGMGLKDEQEPANVPNPNPSVRTIVTSPTKTEDDTEW